MNRRLTAIMLADVVNYSKLMSQDESGTLEALKSHRREVFDPEVSRHGGRIVKLMGDGSLVEFTSVVEAVKCAIAVQNKISHSADTALMLRIGINLGDVISDGDDIYGDGVNVAARLQDMAEPGGICIADTVFEQIDGKVEHQFSDLGTPKLKNITKPVRVYGNFSRVMRQSISGGRHPFFDVGGDAPAKITGGCLCGDVRYEVNGVAIDSGYCHCKMCQRFSGAPIIAGATFPRDGVRFVRGELTYYSSSAIAERGFCSRCGSSLAYRPVARRWIDWIFIYDGSLDDSNAYPPEWHLGVESRVPWLPVDDNLQKVRCDESPGLVQAYDEAEKFK
jgi:adenylate cyclase